MTPFEQGYAAFLAGVGKDDNPFDGEKCPHSRWRWDYGWARARGDRK
jgi:ribosome modulation factor